MGADRNETAGKKKAKNGQGSGKVKSRFYTWRPTKADSDILTDFLRDHAEALAELPNAIRGNLQLKVGYNEENESFYASIYEKVDWPAPAKGLSVWHSDPVKAVLGVVFAAVNVFPDFPDCKWPPGDAQLEW